MASSVQQCPICEYLSPSLVLHVSHLRLVHSQDPSFRFSCNIGGCSQQFLAFSAFNSHVYREHRVALGLEKSGEIISSMNPAPSNAVQISSETALADEYEQTDGSEHGPYTSADQPSFSGASDHVEYLKENAEFIMRLSEGRQLSQVAITDVIKGCRSVCQQAVLQVREGVLSTLADAELDSSSIAGLDVALSSIADPFEGIDSAYLREKYYKKHFNYLVSVFLHVFVLPVTIVLIVPMEQMLFHQEYLPIAIGLHEYIHI